MPRISDLIEEMLREMINENDGMIEVTRGELAQKFKCVPSQINYVLQTRFTHNHGFMIESRRGGGGWIRIYQIQSQTAPQQFIMELVSHMNHPMSRHEIDVHLSNLVARQLMPHPIANLIRAATSDQALSPIESTERADLRSSVFKSMLMRFVEDMNEF